ncbi:hypothetical protein TRFO_36465 [Tritrichomonas foetus]|uniref:Rab3 GTPase-activating protein catalytic subunit n=1 Tax=Tritrichomonas foetus TaxID=1144522 RepID=A0A1J4JE10_9EUKA|nr:hypothetical protein TRFO_36465 [Tritrichomonas foetus]|eukprot:OHS97344.1 hypothetical protein TRFO_36465 [Tritrichomonas foetus]
MNFEHLPLSENWLDFTRVTPIEEAISTVENAFTEWSNPLNYLAKSRFGFQGVYYFLNYVPKNYYKAIRTQEILTLPHHIIDIIRTTFGINSAFVFITNDNKKSNSIHSKSIGNILSILKPAAISTNFALPIFVQISKSEYATLSGFSLCNGIHTIYTSRMDFQMTPPFENIQSIQKTFLSTQQNAQMDIQKDFNVSFRLKLKLNEDPFIGHEEVHYQNVKFYSFMANDPIQRFYLTCDFNNLQKSQKNPAEISLTNYNVFDASNVCVSVKRISSIYHKANTHTFTDWMLRCCKLQSWQSLTPSSPSTSAKGQIMSLFKKCEEANADLSEKSIVKAAPANSLLIKLIELLVNSSVKSNFAAIWKEFVKELRRRSDHHEFLPGVGRDGPDLDNCLIYQKLEMLNVCIKVTNEQNNSSLPEKDEQKSKNPEKSDKLLLDGTPMIFPATQTAPFRTEDQILNSELLLEKNADDVRQKAMLQSDQLKSDMSAFKHVNPTAQFEDFIYWYSPSDFDPKEKKLSTRMSTTDNVWRELWDSAKPDPYGKVLFDPVAQSELALDFLESLAPAELFGDLVPVLLAAAYFDAKEIANTKINAHQKAIELIEDQLKLFHAEVELINDTVSFSGYVDLTSKICTSIEEAMLAVHSASSLLMKFNGNINAVNQLMEYGIYFIHTKEELNALNQLFETIKIDLKNPHIKYVHAKHYILTGFTNNGKDRLCQRLSVSDFIDRVIVASSFQERI